MEFQVRHLVLFLLFSVIYGFGWFWMRSLHKRIKLMLEFLKGSFLVLLFSYYTLMTFLMILSVILLSILMILLHTQSIIRHLIWWNSCNWLLNENLIYKTQWTGAEKGLLISILKTDFRTVGTSLAVSLEPLAHCRNVASFFIGFIFVDVHRNWLNWFHFLILEGCLLAIITDCINFCHHS